MLMLGTGAKFLLVRDLGSACPPTILTFSGENAKLTKDQCLGATSTYTCWLGHGIQWHEWHYCSNTANIHNDNVIVVVVVYFSPKNTTVRHHTDKNIQYQPVTEYFMWFRVFFWVVKKKPNHNVSASTELWREQISLYITKKCLADNHSIL